MKTILKQVLRLWHYLMLSFVFLITYPFLYYFSRKPKRYPHLNLVRKISAFLPSALSGIFYKKHFESEVDWSKTYIVCANHASNLDVLALTCVVANNFFYLGKEELLDNPFTSLYFKTIDIPINRESKIASFRAFKKTSERIAEGHTAIIFPEGKIGEEYPPILHPFKNGPFKLAIENQVPILPITLIDNFKLCWDDGKKFGCKPGISSVYIHTPIETKGLTAEDDEVLKQKVYDKINSKIEY